MEAHTRQLIVQEQQKKQRQDGVTFDDGIDSKGKIDFVEFWSKLLKYFTKNLFCSMKLLLQHREENIKVFLPGRTNYNQFSATSLKYTGRT